MKDKMATFFNLLNLFIVLILLAGCEKRLPNLNDITEDKNDVNNKSGKLDKNSERYYDVQVLCPRCGTIHEGVTILNKWQNVITCRYCSMTIYLPDRFEKMAGKTVGIFPRLQDSTSYWKLRRDFGFHKFYTNKWEIVNLIKAGIPINERIWSVHGGNAWNIDSDADSASTDIITMVDPNGSGVLLRNVVGGFLYDGGVERDLNTKHDINWFNYRIRRIRHVIDSLDDLRDRQIRSDGAPRKLYLTSSRDVENRVGLGSYFSYYYSILNLPIPLPNTIISCDQYNRSKNGIIPPGLFSYFKAIYSSFNDGNWIELDSARVGQNTWNWYTQLQQASDLGLTEINLGFDVEQYREKKIYEFCCACWRKGWLVARDCSGRIMNP